jgi:murein tripeptide amidase MpaA
VVNIGKTNQGRPLQALLLSTTLDVNSPAYFSKPTIIFDGLHHAREVMTPEIVLDVAEMLIKNQNRKFFNDILKSWNVWIVPMVNPDGSNIVWTSNSMWRKNARAGMASIYGVDVNRNYAYRWAECRGSSGNTGADDYRGTAAGSEPETMAMMGLADFTHPTASISYHSWSTRSRSSQTA